MIQKQSKTFLSLSTDDQEWVLTYLSTWKDTIPYQLITDFDFLNISPEEDDFFAEYLFYSNMKDSKISPEEYENVKKFYALLKLSNLGELNRLYNFHDSQFSEKYLSKGQNY